VTVLGVTVLGVTVLGVTVLGVAVVSDGELLDMLDSVLVLSVHVSAIVQT
jgi:hypothetical protein